MTAAPVLVRRASGGRGRRRVRGDRLLVDDYFAERDAGPHRRRAAAILDDHGIELAEVEFLFDWSAGPDEPERVENARQTGGPGVGDGRRVRTRVVSVGELVRRRELPPFDVLVERFAALCDRAADHDLLVALEFMPFSGIPDVADAACTHSRQSERAERGPQRRLVALLPRHPGSRRAAPPCGDRVFMIQLDDADEEVVGELFEDTMFRRRYPGEGSFDLVGSCALLDEVGRPAPKSVEILSAEHQALPVGGGSPTGARLDACRRRRGARRERMMQQEYVVDGGRRRARCSCTAACPTPTTSTPSSPSSPRGTASGDRIAAATARRPTSPGPITYENMAADTIAFLEQVVGERAHVIGYSDGAMVGLLVALRRPELVRKLVLMGLYVNRDGEVEWFGRYVRDGDGRGRCPESIRRAYNERSPDGAEHFDEVAEKILRLWRTEPNLPLDALRELTVPTLLLQGDDDIVTLEHGVAMAARSPTRSSPWCPEPVTRCRTRSPRSSRSCSSTSSPTSSPAPDVHRRGVGSLNP